MKADGTVEVSGAMGVKLAAGASSVEAAVQGVSASGMKVRIAGTALAEITGPIVKIN